MISEPTRQLLEWLSVRPRSYDETMDAWRTSCPRLSVWEDANIDGLVTIEDGTVVLTANGRAELRPSSAPARTP